MNKGATKFIIVLNCLSGSLNSSHQLNRILNRKRNSISFATPSNINTVKDAVELIAQANKIAPLEAVYFVLVVSIFANSFFYTICIRCVLKRSLYFFGKIG